MTRTQTRARSRIVTTIGAVATIAAVGLAPAGAANAATHRGETYPGRGGITLECNVARGPVCREMGAPNGGLSLAKCKEYQWVQYTSSVRAWSPRHKVTATGCHRADGSWGYVVRVYR